jgi:lysophospholipase L1-like esterase
MKGEHHPKGQRIVLGNSVMRFGIIIPVLAILVLQDSCKSFKNDRVSQPVPIRAACIGDSITFGANIQNRGHDSYPADLQRMLGKHYEVGNFGVSGANLIKKGDKSYWQEPEFLAATTFAPDIVIILLGTNDTKPQNWKYKSDFSADLRGLISHFAALPSKPKVWICIPVPVYKSNWGINQPALDELMPMIRQVAEEQKVPVIDLFAALSNHPDFFADGIHPNEKGAECIAAAICKNIYSAN